MRAQLAVISSSQSELAMYCVIMSRDRHVSELHVMRECCSRAPDTLWAYYRNDGCFFFATKFNLQNLIWLKFNHAIADDKSYLLVKFQTDWPKKFFWWPLHYHELNSCLCHARHAPRGAHRAACTARRAHASVRKLSCLVETQWCLKTYFTIHTQTL